MSCLFVPYTVDGMEEGHHVTVLQVAGVVLLARKDEKGEHLLIADMCPPTSWGSHLSDVFPLQTLKADRIMDVVTYCHSSTVVGGELCVHTAQILVDGLKILAAVLSHGKQTAASLGVHDRLHLPIGGS